MKSEVQSYSRTCQLVLFFAHTDHNSTYLHNNYSAFIEAMASIRLCRHSQCHIYFQRRCLNTSSKLKKKQYGYDLDSLVKWKQETKLLFGPERRSTKSGKLKKKKTKLDEQCLENIETLSSLSYKDRDELSKNPNLTGDSQRTISGSRNLVSECEQIVSNPQIISFEEGSSRKKSMKQTEGVKEKRKNFSNSSNFSESVSEIEPVISSHRPLDTSSKFETNGRKNYNISSTHDNTAGQQTDEIEIPKLEPVPSNKDTAFSNKTTMPEMSHVPMEAPTSFEVITKFPLAPLEIPDGPRVKELQSFKMDVEKMALRMLPSVKTVLNKTMSDLSRFFLNRWREGMINELGEEGFQKYKNETLRQGTNLHANIMEYLSGKQESELQIMPDNEGHWTSLHSALQSVSDIRALEMDIIHPALLYRGVFDCVARHNMEKSIMVLLLWLILMAAQLTFT
ncbi:hypothetical protein RRG08_000638 [Elysia crispata]|uniref:Uncharacterized protein n=1 Tax=Elysia crispata TaxID=231223 RepID=A0AAE0Y9G6_9GAST|nr:hypothetical protein RRG08_000638 [Elysia crispata]